MVKRKKNKKKDLLKKIDKELTITEYDEIKYWLANAEVLDNTDYILNNRKAKILVRYLKEKGKEIERLNDILYGKNEYIKMLEKQHNKDKNIIDELEKDIKNLYTYGIKNNTEQKDYLLNRIDGLRQAKELKEGK